MTALAYQDCLDVASARDAATFQRRLELLAARLGFPLVNATLVVEQPAAAPLLASVNNVPDAFLGATTDPVAGRRDPVYQRLKITSTPFIYDQSTYVDHAAGDLWEEQAAHGYRTGVAMALHMSGGRHFYMGVDRAAPLPGDPDQVVRLLADLQLLAVFAQETAVRLLMPQVVGSDERPALTSREREILQWTVAGKSSAVVGQILGISLSTVNFHLRSAMGKLGVATKHQAAAKANALGLL